MGVRERPRNALREEHANRLFFHYERAEKMKREKRDGEKHPSTNLCTMDAEVRARLAVILAEVEARRRCGSSSGGPSNYAEPVAASPEQDDRQGGASSETVADANAEQHNPVQRGTGRSSDDAAAPAGMAR